MDRQINKSQGKALPYNVEGTMTLEIYYLPSIIILTDQLTIKNGS